MRDAQTRSHLALERVLFFSDAVFAIAITLLVIEIKVPVLQRQLRAQGVQFQMEADEATTGPGAFVTVDPDGNPILVDQHR